MARWDTAGNVINDAAVECGLTAASDPFASLDPAFIQLCRILTSACRELIGMHQWQRFVAEHSILTTALDTGQYTLPTDFLYMIDQTGWSSTSGLPLGGPLSAVDWQYITKSGLGPQTVYVSFREAEGEFWILPNDPVTAGITITFEYIRNTFALAAADGTTAINRLTASGDTVLFPPILIMKLLKLRFLEAKGFDTTAALGQLNTALATWLPKDKSAPVLNMAGRRTYPYLDYRNVPETNFGS